MDLGAKVKLSNTKNHIGIDWVMNAELNNQDSQIIKMLELKNIVVFLKKGELKADGKFGSKVAVDISKTWSKIDEGFFFDVYTYKKDVITQDDNSTL